MLEIKSAHWKIFNALGRLVGVGFALVGAFFLVWGIARRDWIIGGSGLVVVALGVLLSLARSSSSDITDSRPD